MSQGDSDAELAVQLRDGDTAALGRLYDRYIGGVHDFLVRFTRDPSAAEDLAHATFLRAWERRTTLRDPSRVRAWLYATAHNLALNHLTRGQPVSSIDDEAAGRISDPAPGPEEEAVARDVAELVWSAASSLGARQYAVLDLSVRHGLSTREIADVLEVPVGHAAVLVNRAREALGNAVRYLLVARRRDHCERLATLVPAGIRALTARQRSAVDHHMRRCETCQELGQRLTAPTALLGALMPLPLPATLGHLGRERLVAAVHAVPPSTAPSGPSWPPRRLPWDGRERTIAAGLASLLILVLLLGGGAAQLLRPSGAPGTSHGRGVPAGGPAVAATPIVTPSPALTPEPVVSVPGSLSPEPVAAVGLGATTPSPVVPVTAAPVRTTSTPAPGPSRSSGTPTPSPVGTPVPTPTSKPTPTPTPSPPVFRVALVVVAYVNTGTCPRELLGLLLYVCAFKVDVNVANGTPGEVVTGTLTVTSSDGERYTLPFTTVVTAAEAHTLSLNLSVAFWRCPMGTASATTSSPNAVPSNVANFGRC